MNRKNGFVFLFCLVTQASLVAGVEAELSGFTKANALSPASPLALAHYRSPSVLENDATVSDDSDANGVESVNDNGNVVVNENNEVDIEAYKAPKHAAKPNASRREPRIALAEPRFGEVADSYTVGQAKTRIGLTPMVGVNGYIGPWNANIMNPYALGLAVEIPVSSMVSTEIEGSYASYRVNYLVSRINFVHDFNQYSLGANGKFYLMRGIFRPYVGGGLAGVLYENMAYGPYSPLRYDQWIVSGQLMGGAEFEVSDGISIGGRAAWVKPLFNRPYTMDNGFMSAPGFEEAALINTDYYRLMGTVKVSF